MNLRTIMVSSTHFFTYIPILCTAVCIYSHTQFRDIASIFEGGPNNSVELPEQGSGGTAERLFAAINSSKLNRLL